MLAAANLGVSSVRELLAASVAETAWVTYSRRRLHLAPESDFQFNRATAGLFEPQPRGMERRKCESLRLKHECPEMSTPKL
jgi:hypothetical protein